jgi:very-short-patch-repair endonuclease
MSREFNVRLDIGHPVTTAQAVSAGIAQDALKGPYFRRVFRGVYAHRDLALTARVRIEAALRIHPANAFASHASAARLYELPIPDSFPDEHVTVASARERRRRIGIRNHVVADAPDVRVVGGVRCSAPAQTFVELGTMLGLVDLVVIGDQLVRKELCTPEELVEAAAAAPDHRADLARHAARYVRRDVDSPMETRLRMLLVLAGLPEPTVNFKIRDADGIVRLRFDLSYPDLKVVVEYDGRQHFDDDEQVDHDNDRDDWFALEGWRVVKVTSRGIYKEPAKTVARVHKALAAVRCTRLPQVLSEEWRPYFPVRRSLVRRTGG